MIVPLAAEEVAKFWASFRTFRDLALVGLMLLDGLRSCAVLALQIEDLQLGDAQMWVLGKGSKKRILPLPGELIEVLQNYLWLERPLTNSRCLFVSLKGRRRGQPMTSVGLRALFRHHRTHSEISHANPHRLRHTFGADMVRAGISLPVTRPATLDGALADPNHHALRPACSPGCLARVHTGGAAPNSLIAAQRTVTPSRPSRWSLKEILKDHIRTLATTLQPETILGYGTALNHFLAYLRVAFPEVRHLSQLRRDPHLLGWFRWLCEQNRPLSNATRRNYLNKLRRLFYDLADNGHSHKLD